MRLTRSLRQLFAFSVASASLLAGTAARADDAPTATPPQERCDWFLGGPGLGVPLIVISAVVLLGGVTMMVAGNAMWSPPKPDGAKPPVANTAFVREPTWTAATPASPAKGRPLVVPLTFSF